MTKSKKLAVIGLTDVVDGTKAFSNKVSALLEDAFDIKPVSRYNKVLIVDTFFSDTLSSTILSEIFHLSKKWNTEIKIALLDPFTSQAHERAEIFKPDNSITRINKGLHRIKNALSSNISFSDIDYEQNCNKKHYIFKQIEQINSLKRDEKYSKIEIKFTSDYKFPLFIFGQFACSGYYLCFNTAAKLPWCIWEDDAAKAKDQYSNFIKHFDEIWKHSGELRKTYLTNSAKKTIQNVLAFANKKILVAYSREDVRNKVLIECRNAGFIPKEFSQNSSEKKSDGVISNILLKMFRDCNSAIVILTKDEKVKNEWRPRPNVLVELGYAQAKYQNRVLLLVEKGVTIPTNYSGKLYSEFSKGENGNYLLDERFSNFFKSIG